MHDARETHRLVGIAPFGGMFDASSEWNSLRFRRFNLYGEFWLAPAGEIHPITTECRMCFSAFNTVLSIHQIADFPKA